MSAVGIVIAVVLVVLAVIAVVAVLARRKSRTPDPPAVTKPPLEPPAPMLGLETALDQATDRSGRNMRERMESQSTVDDLRVPDDTGPVLRRALDHVESANVEPAPAEPAGFEPPTVSDVVSDAVSDAVSDVAPD